jgi:hypothetical protein
VDPPVVLIASGGSSGSHLLAVLLAGRHPFFTGPEVNLASRPDLFSRGSFRLALMKGLLRQEPYFRPFLRRDGREFHVVPPQLLTNADSYEVDVAAAKLHLLQATGGWAGMVRAIHGRLVRAGRIREHDVLVEHAPSCAVSVAVALRAVPKLRVVHLMRDPRDAVASMVARRRVAPQYKSLSAEESLALTARQWALLTAAALQAQEHPGYLRISYEEVVRRPQSVTAELCRHFGFRDAVPRERGPLLVGPVPRREGWLSTPTDEVTAASVGRFRTTLSARHVKRLSGMRFQFPELGERVEMQEMIERFGVA